MDNKTNLRDLLNKYLSGNYTVDELNTLIAHFQITDDAKVLDRFIEQYFAQESSELTTSLRSEEIIAKADLHMAKVVPVIRSTDTNSVPKPLWNMRLWGSVAAAVAVMTLGVWLYYYRMSPAVKSREQVVNDIAPGKQGATLTLANGKRIKLSDVVNGELAEEAGMKITKTADGQLIYEIASLSASSRNDDHAPSLVEGTASTDASGTKQSHYAINTLSTANGETYRVKLPDGSNVWLNSASSLTYSANLLKNGKRSVKLDGEAYFSVAKDKSHPFVVESRGQQVEVLGTEFNVNSYADESAVATALVEGSVKITSEGQQKVIKPGEQLINDGKNLAIGKADLENITDWKAGDFNFEGLDFRSAMRKVARWYNVEVVYEADFPQHSQPGGWFSRSQKLSTILRAFEHTKFARFRISGNVVYVAKYE